MTRLMSRRRSKVAASRPSGWRRNVTSETPTTFAAASCSASRISIIVARGTDRSNPPASPLVQMQYATSIPASVQPATVPALPKSTSSGCAVTTRMRSTSLSGSICRRYPVIVGSVGGRALAEQWIVRRHREVASLTPEHRAPQTGRIGREEVVGSRVDDEPAAGVELAFELRGTPSRVAGEDAHRFEVGARVVRVAPEIDGADEPEQRLPRVAVAR